jgi:hypothetical protein
VPHAIIGWLTIQFPHIMCRRDAQPLIPHAATLIMHPACLELIRLGEPTGVGVHSTPAHNVGVK